MKTVACPQAAAVCVRGRHDNLHPPLPGQAQGRDQHLSPAPTHRVQYLYYTVLYCTILYCTELQGITPIWYLYAMASVQLLQVINTSLYCTVLYCTVRYCTAQSPVLVSGWRMSAN